MPCTTWYANPIQSPRIASSSALSRNRLCNEKMRIPWKSARFPTTPSPAACLPQMTIWLSSTHGGGLGSGFYADMIHMPARTWQLQILIVDAILITCLSLVGCCQGHCRYGNETNKAYNRCNDPHGFSLQRDCSNLIFFSHYFGLSTTPKLAMLTWFAPHTQRCGFS